MTRSEDEWVVGFIALTYSRVVQSTLMFGFKIDRGANQETIRPKLENKGLSGDMKGDQDGCRHLVMRKGEKAASHAEPDHNDEESDRTRRELQSRPSAEIGNRF